LARYLIAVVFSALVGSAGLAAYAADLLDGIAAQVGTEVVLISEVKRIAEPIEKRMASGGAPEQEIEQMKAEVLDSLIENRLLDLTAQQIEVEAEDEEIDQAIASIAAENRISLETMRRSVEAQGLSYEKYRQKIGQEIVRQKLMGGMVHSKVDIPEEAIRELFEERYSDQPSGGFEAHIFHLIVPAIERKRWAIDIACEEAGEARARIEGGEDFLQVASESTPTSSDLGWIAYEDLAAWMLSGIRPLRPGETSEVLSLDFGCSVLHLVDRREVRPRTYEEVRPELEAELFEREFEVQSDLVLDQLRDRTYIEKRGVFAGSGQLEFDPRP
jgi:peptidyl-prolyl cis-trans isomerase SurA